MVNSIKAKRNATIVYDIETGQPRMVVIDANDLSDPAFNPQGSIQIDVPIIKYNARIEDQNAEFPYDYSDKEFTKKTGKQVYKNLESAVDLAIDSATEVINQ